jgi:hypothetical protein
MSLMALTQTRVSYFCSSVSLILVKLFLAVHKLDITASEFTGCTTHLPPCLDLDSATNAAATKHLKKVLTCIYSKKLFAFNLLLSVGTSVCRMVYDNLSALGTKFRESSVMWQFTLIGKSKSDWCFTHFRI